MIASGVVREAGASDVAGIVDLIHSAFAESAAWDRPSSALLEREDDWRDAIEADRFRVLVRVDDAGPIGVLRYQSDPDGWWSFARVAVSPVVRRRGIARGLLRALEQRANEFEAVGLRCTSRAEDGEGQRLYPACGFVEAGRSIVMRSGAEIPVVRWEKRLEMAVEK
ncbi:MAG: N-acetyltransferase family protein [Armatimonadota bacterium]